MWVTLVYQAGNKPASIKCFFSPGVTLSEIIDYAMKSHKEWTLLSFIVRLNYMDYA